MKTCVTLLCGFLIVVAFVQALPADSELKKLGRVELEKDAEEFPVPDVPPNNPLFFDGIFGGVSDIFERMRQQMLYLMSHIPRIGLTPPEGGNTTSVTKVIDGHKVVINETIYTSGNGEDTSAVFKVRVVDIRPDSTDDSSNESGVSTSKDIPKGSVESLEFSQENEISKSSKNVHQQKRKVNNMEYLDDDLANNYNNLETFDEPDNGLETFNEQPNNSLETFDEELSDNGETADNSIENEIEGRPIIDLTNDILVNKYAEHSGKTTNADAEFLPDFQPPRDLSRDTYINEIAKNYGRQPNPDAEVFAPSLYVNNPSENAYDLSRDTYVNEIGNLPLNPDAEFIEPFPRSRYFYRTENS